MFVVVPWRVVASVVLFLLVSIVLLQVAKRLQREWHSHEVEAMFVDNIVDHYAEYLVESRTHGSRVGSFFRTLFCGERHVGSAFGKMVHTVLREAFLRELYPSLEDNDGLDEDDDLRLVEQLLEKAAHMEPVVLTKATSSVYRKSIQVYAFETDSRIEVHKNWGVSKGNPDDWIICGSGGDVYVAWAPTAVGTARSHASHPPAAVACASQLHELQRRVHGELRTSRTQRAQQVPQGGCVDEPRWVRHRASRDACVRGQKTTVFARKMRCSFVASKPNGDTVMGKKGYYLVQSRVRVAVMLVHAGVVLCSFSLTRRCTCLLGFRTRMGQSSSTQWTRQCSHNSMNRWFKTPPRRNLSCSTWKCVYGLHARFEPTHHAAGVLQVRRLQLGALLQHPHGLLPR